MFTPLSGTSKLQDSMFHLVPLLRLLARFDHELPLALTDNIWLHMRHPHLAAPRCALEWGREGGRESGGKLGEEGGEGGGEGWGMSGWVAGLVQP